MPSEDKNFHFPLTLLELWSLALCYMSSRGSRPGIASISLITIIYTICLPKGLSVASITSYHLTMTFIPFIVWKQWISVAFL